jgi:hypothetical protein
MAKLAKKLPYKEAFARFLSKIRPRNRFAMQHEWGFNSVRQRA